VQKRKKQQHSQEMLYSMTSAIPDTFDKMGVVVESRRRIDHCSGPDWVTTEPSISSCTEQQEGTHVFSPGGNRDKRVVAASACALSPKVSA
jgi:hypothetical protein